MNGGFIHHLPADRRPDITGLATTAGWATPLEDIGSVCIIAFNAHNAQDVYGPNEEIWCINANEVPVLRQEFRESARVRTAREAGEHRELVEAELSEAARVLTKRVYDLIRRYDAIDHRKPPFSRTYTIFEPEDSGWEKY